LQREVRYFIILIPLSERLAQLKLSIIPKTRSGTMKVLVNTSAQRLHLEGGIYRLNPGERKPIYEGDENKGGIVSAIMKGWARVEDTDETLADFVEVDSRAPRIVFEEETIAAPSNFGDDKPTISAVGSKQGVVFEEETYDAQGRLVTPEAAPEAEMDVDAVVAPEASEKPAKAPRKAAKAAA
jgi:hypothetical protein